MGDKSHWLAGSFSFCLPGLGQLYGRRFAKAVFFFLLFLAIQASSILRPFNPLFCLLAALEAFKFSGEIVSNYLRNYIYASVAVIAFLFWFLGFAPQVIPVAFGNDLALTCSESLGGVVKERERAVSNVKYQRFLAAGIVHTLGMSFFTGMAMSNASSGRYAMPMLLLGSAMAAVEVVPLIRYFLQRDSALKRYHQAYSAYLRSSKLLSADPVSQITPSIAVAEVRPEPMIRLAAETSLKEDLLQIISLHRDFVVGANSDTVEKTSRRMLGELAEQVYAKHHLNRESLLKIVKEIAPELNYQGFLTPQ